MTPAKWFEQTWTKAGETQTRAILRMQLRTGVAPMTIRRVFFDREPVRAATAITIAKLTKGALDARDLVLGAPKSSRVRAPKAPMITASHVEAA